MPTILNFTDLQKMLELEKSSFSDYPDLQVIADNVHAALENYCGRMLDYTQKRKQKGILNGIRLDVFALPIVSISSLDIDETYTITPWALEFTATHENTAYNLTVKGGFSEIPEDIYRAELSQVVYEFQQKNNLATTSFSNSGGTTSSPGFVLLDEVMRLITPYIHPKKSGF